MRRQRKRAADLRRAIDCLPRTTREAMLDGMESNAIIVGGYTDGSGGICPMLAAHRGGGRTSLASFARAWDRYTDAAGVRRATTRELRTLRAMLEASLWYEPDRGDLDRAVAELKERGREQPRRDTGERNRAPELARRPGWAWLRVFRRLDDWESALEKAEREQDAVPADERELERV